MTTNGGLSLVGERGPELLHLPTGATVIPLTDARVRQVAEGQQVAYQSPASDSGASIIVNVQGSVLSERDLVEVVQRAARRGVRGLN